MMPVIYIAAHGVQVKLYLRGNMHNGLMQVFLSERSDLIKYQSQDVEKRAIDFKT